MDGLDYDETFTPGEPFDILLLIVGKFTSVGWNVYYGAIHTAFLNGDTEGELYVRWDYKCYKKQKSLYGLRQSLLLCREKVKSALESFAFTQHWSRECFFEFNDDTQEVIIWVHVDDSLILVECATP